MGRKSWASFTSTLAVGIGNGIVMLMIDVMGVSEDIQRKVVDNDEAACTLAASVCWRKVGCSGDMLSGSIGDGGWIGGGGCVSHDPLIKAATGISGTSIMIGRVDGMVG